MRKKCLACLDHPEGCRRCRSEDELTPERRALLDSIGQLPISDFGPKFQENMSKHLNDMEPDPASLYDSLQRGYKP